MNWLLIVVIGIIAIFALRGRQVGFIRTAFSLCSLVLALFLTVTINPYVSKTLQNNEKVQAYVSEAVAKVVVVEKNEKTVTGQMKEIKKLDLPNALKKSLIENNNTEVYKAYAINSFKDYVNHYITTVIINAASFIVTLIVIQAILFMIGGALDVISRLPILNGLNKSAGLLIGVLHGLVIIWVLCILLTTFGGTKWASEIFAQINQDKILTLIYDNNLLLTAVTSIAKILF